MVKKVDENSGETTDYNYNPDFKRALRSCRESGNDQELFKLFEEKNWRRYLGGYKLKKGKKGHRPVSFPLLDLIQWHPSVAYAVFSKLIRIKVDGGKKEARRDDDFVGKDENY